MNTTVRVKASEIYKDWHVIDAAGRPLGRVASEAATLLRGKHKPTYERHLDDGDFVIIINASQVRVTGRKAEQNIYYRHSGYPGGLHQRTYTEQLEKFPERVLEQAVWGMLPGGALGKAMLKHLKVFRNANHPHSSQVTGSERARETRATANAEALLQPRRAPRLRPLSVPEAPHVRLTRAEKVAASAAAAPPRPAAAPKAAAPKAAAPKAAAAATDKPKAARKTAAPKAEAAPGEAKPARTRRTKAETETAPKAED
jgi:large subunit ribosomal protein L13